MTAKELATLKAYRATLERIARDYLTPAQLKRRSGGDYGLDHDEALEMAYENIQQEARAVLRQFRMPRKPKPPTTTGEGGGS